MASPYSWRAGDRDNRARGGGGGGFSSLIMYKPESDGDGHIMNSTGL